MPPSEPSRPPFRPRQPGLALGEAPPGGLPAKIGGRARPSAGGAPARRSAGGSAPPNARPPTTSAAAAAAAAAPGYLARTPSKEHPALPREARAALSAVARGLLLGGEGRQQAEADAVPKPAPAPAPAPPPPRPASATPPARHAPRHRPLPRAARPLSAAALAAA